MNIVAFCSSQPLSKQGAIFTGQDVAVIHDTQTDNHDKLRLRPQTLDPFPHRAEVLVKPNSTANRVQTLGHNHDDDGIMLDRQETDTERPGAASWPVRSRVAVVDAQPLSPSRVAFMQNCNPAATDKRPAPRDQQALCIGSSTFQLFKDGWRAAQPRHPRIRPKSPELCICQNAFVQRSRSSKVAPPSPASRALRHTRIFTESLVFLQVCSQQVENGHLLQVGPDGIPSGDYWRSGKECLSLIQTEPSRPHPWLARISIWLESVQHALSSRHHLKDKHDADAMRRHSLMALIKSWGTNEAGETLSTLATAGSGGRGKRRIPPDDRRETWGPKNNEVQLVSRLAATARRPTPADGTGSKTPLLALTFDSTACPFAAPKTEQPPLA
ncbi:hypothetical protein CMUS01_06205 [Colletotrichum musicola]|uniref:Uncharacterized protein n=1 Tax=Colletotrichum musicola TaxID=2175873 RepID=A0A8H6NJ21_9PEZI|nr:hypothetical protein CMUS01_06205 [Colletotrichum musicola]